LSPTANLCTSKEEKDFDKISTRNEKKESVKEKIIRGRTSRSYQ
jgi:hypothetical protein